MIGLLKIKALLIGLLLASPPVAAWMIYRPQQAPAAVHLSALGTAAAAPGTREELRIPVEILAKGNTPETIYVEMRTEAVPEPASLPLVLLPALLLVLRRRR